MASSFRLAVYALSLVALAGGGLARAADTAETCSRPGVLLPIHGQLLSELNLARTHPDAYADFIAEKFASLSERNIYLEDGARVVMQEGRPAINEAIDFLRHAEPVPPLRLSPCLVLAAQDHVRSQGPTGTIGHNGTDGSDPSMRAEKYLAGKAYCGENISYGKGSARDITIQLLVDDGIPARGHRRNVFNPQYRTVGFGVGQHARYKAMAVQLMCINEL